MSYVEPAGTGTIFYGWKRKRGSNSRPGHSGWNFGFSADVATGRPRQQNRIHNVRGSPALALARPSEGAARPRRQGKAPKAGYQVRPACSRPGAALLHAGARSSGGRTRAHPEGAGAEKACFNTLRDEHLNDRDPWHASRSFIRSEANRGGTTQVPHLEAAHGRLLEAMANPALPERAVPVDESTQESPSGPHTRLEAAGKLTARKRRSCRLSAGRLPTATCICSTRNTSSQRTPTPWARAPKPSQAIDTTVMKTYLNDVSPFCEPESIEPEAAYRALRKAARYGRCEILRNNGYRHKLSRDLGAIDRLTHEISQESALRASECASVTPVEASGGAPRTSPEFYPGSHPPGSTMFPQAMERSRRSFDWIAAWRELIGKARAVPARRQQVGRAHGRHGHPGHRRQDQTGSTTNMSRRGT